MNPARSLGPALVSGHTQFLWLYLMAPLTGMALAVPLFKFMKEEISPWLKNQLSRVCVHHPGNDIIVILLN
jgi:hypothetical protein